MKEFHCYKTLFAEFYQAIKEKHTSVGQRNRGHGLDHDVTVAQIGVRIAPDERTADKAWVAGMLHSLDHLIEHDDKNDPAVSGALATLLSHLPKDYFSSEEVGEIGQAALRHSELNRDDQSLTQQVLMDADRLANLQVSIMIRGGQYRPTIPPLEFEYLDKINPSSTYREPKNVLDNIRLNMSEYVPQLRLSKAKDMGRQYEARLKAYLQEIQKDYDELGLKGARF